MTLSLKSTGVAPGDVTDKQLDAIADLADRYSFGEVRNSHEQNMILADVEQARLFELWHELRELGLATPNIGLLTDIICCPGAISARWPTPSRSRSPKPSSVASTTSITCSTWATST